jgi:hypothetical protein
VGTPAAGELTPAPGAGHGGEGDASLQGPAQEPIETLPELPKPTNPIETATAARADVTESVAEQETNAASASIIVLRPNQPEIDSEAAGIALAHPKPEKRLNAKQRAQAKLKGKSATEKSAKDGTTPDTTATAKSKAETKQAKAEAKSKAKSKAKEKAKADKKADKRKE